MAQLVQDDLLFGGLPAKHKVARNSNHAHQPSRINKDSLVRSSMAATRLGGCHAQVATSGMSAHAVPQTSIATTHHPSLSATSQEQDAKKAKVVRVAPFASELRSASGSGPMVARQTSERKPLGGQLQVDAILHASNPASAKRLEHIGTSSDHGRALPKAAAIIRGFKSHEEGLQRSTSCLSLTGAPSKTNALSETFGLHHHKKVKRDTGAALAPLGDIPRQPGR